ncbi:MAG: nitrite/sulfite reductase [bacterium]
MKTFPCDGQEDPYGGLALAIATYQAGALTGNQLKPVLAPSGIYEQRNGLFMLRVRLTGGHLESATLAGLAGVMERNQIPRAHLSSRQAIQLHDVSVGNIISTLRACHELGLPFKGGGGNTYRNILISADSGLAPDEGFDVLPYAKAIHLALAARPEAFLLPRKFKIGMFTKPTEAFTAAAQDLGFLAVTSGGRRGFAVYGGGGMGRESDVGIKLFDFLPHDQFIRCTLAMLHFFSDHGDRTNRNQARIRFILKRRGAETFARLFHFYFEQTVWAPPVLLPAPDYSALAGRPVAASVQKVQDAGYEVWTHHAVGLTRFGPGQSTVRLYVPYGNLTPEHCRGLAKLAEDSGGRFLRLMPSQDLLIGPVCAAALPDLYRRLISDFPGVDLTLRSFKGHIATCVGSAVCKIGVLPAPALADTLAEHLDRLLPADTPEKMTWLRRITDDIRISGCLNSCSGHPAARFGFQGAKQRVGDKVEDVVMPFTGCSLAPDDLRLSSCDPATPAISLDHFPAVVAQAIGLKGL